MKTLSKTSIIFTVVDHHQIKITKFDLNKNWTINLDTLK
jgi:hypothetical protein